MFAIPSSLLRPAHDSSCCLSGVLVLPVVWQVRLDGKDVNLVGLKVVANDGCAYGDVADERHVGELVSTKSGIRVR
jgi:hypothetical protein